MWGENAFITILSSCYFAAWSYLTLSSLVFQKLSQRLTAYLRETYFLITVEKYLVSVAFYETHWKGKMSYRLAQTRTGALILFLHCVSAAQRTLAT